MLDSSRSRLPPFHISRPRLTAECADARVVAVEAAGGYGKSVFAAELTDAWGAVPIWVLLEEGGVTARLLAGRLRAAAGHAGLSDAAAQMATAGDDPPGAVDALLATLSDEACALVFDDAHNADRDAAALIDRIAERLTAPQRLVVLARRLPAGAPRLRRAGVLTLTAADLALRPAETLELCRTGFGLEVSADEGRQLDLATGGWTAAAALAASMAKRTSQRLGAVAHLTGAPADALGAILGEVVASLAIDPGAVAQLGHLPLLDADLLALVGGDVGFFERALASGLPMTQAEGGWWQLPGPVRDLLAGRAGADPGLLRAAADHYERRGKLGTALQMLLSAGEEHAAARLLSETEPWRIETVDVLELLSVVDRIPAAALDAHPRAMLEVARLCGAAVMPEARARLLARADTVVDAATAPELRRAVDAEMLIEMINSDDPLQALEPGRRLLEEACAGEQLTRARTLTSLGQAAYFRREADGSVSAATLREAADLLRQAYEIYLGMGHRAAAGGLAPHRAIWIELGLGRPLEALAIISDGMALTSDKPRRFLRILFFRTQILTELGRFAEVDADLDEVLRIAHQLGDEMMVSYVDWQRMILSSLLGDAERALHHARETEAGSRRWWHAASAHFLADAAEALDRAGQTALAAEYLARAREEPKDSDRLIAMAECATLARHGEPAVARERLATVHRRGIAPRERWRVTLLDAYAAHRLGSGDAGAIAARAFEQAARLGQPRLPLIRERELTESLLALAGDTGLPAARALEHDSLPMSVAVLGRFELTRGGRPIALPPGQGEQLIKLIAVSGGRLQAEQAIEALWPDAGRDAGRNRLRTVLSRLRDSGGDAVQREGELLALAPDVRLDLTEFRREAREAQALAKGDPTAAVAIARSAIARYRGPLLPHDPYEGWAEEPRESARATMLDLLDLCADAAVRRGDLDEARRTVQRTIELAPYDDDRWLAVATILRDQGRRGAALSVLRRARAALAQLGLDPPHKLAELEREIASEALGRSPLTV